MHSSAGPVSLSHWPQAELTFIWPSLCTVSLRGLWIVQGRILRSSGKCVPSVHLYQATDRSLIAVVRTRQGSLRPGGESSRSNLQGTGELCGAKGSLQGGQLRPVLCRLLLAPVQRVQLNSACVSPSTDRNLSAHHPIIASRIHSLTESSNQSVSQLSLPLQCEQSSQMSLSRSCNKANPQAKHCCITHIR